MRRTLYHKLLFVLLLTILAPGVCFVLIPATHSYALPISNKKPELTLNRAQGPLGVTLMLRGKNFPPGPANLSYIDAHNVPGIFQPPSDTSVEVQPSGLFLTTNLVLPASGPVGAWKIVVTDSQGALTTIRYTALATPGKKSAGIPTLSLTLPSGVSASSSATATPTASATAISSGSNSIAFTGSNWLPKGTAVKLILYSGATSLPLLEPPPTSNASGDISGSFNMPANLSFTSATIIASDVSTGALRAQIPIAINNGVVSFSPVSTPQPIGTTPVTSAASTPVSGATGPDTFTNPFGKLDAAIWGPVLLVVGGMLAIAGLMLILFMIPWSGSERRKGQHTRSGQF